MEVDAKVGQTPPVVMDADLHVRKKAPQPLRMVPVPAHAVREDERGLVQNLSACSSLLGVGQPQNMASQPLHDTAGRKQGQIRERYKNGNAPCNRMQGTFASLHRPSEKRKTLEAGAGTDWDSVLEPGNSEKTTEEYKKQRANEAARIIAMGPAPPGVPMPAIHVDEPKPPDASFVYHDRTVFIVKNGQEQDFGIRTGELGHYLTPYTIIKEGGVDKAKPFPAPTQNAINIERIAFHFSGPRPSLSFSQPMRDFVVPGTPGDVYYEISHNTLRKLLETSENMDYRFAKRMEGFQNVASNVVWECIDPDFNPADRQAVMNQFMSKYLDRFYARIDPGNEPDVRGVSAEALHKHKSFCQEWVIKHYKNITPIVTSSAENLASNFYPYFEAFADPDHLPTRMDLARILMRHERFAAQFASALYYCITTLDHTRGGRNANITQMRNSAMAKQAEYNRLDAQIAANGQVISDIFRTFREFNTKFNPLVVDWYDILGQMPQVHKYFDDIHSLTTATIGTRAGRQQVPPWKFGKD